MNSLAFVDVASPLIEDSDKSALVTFHDRANRMLYNPTLDSLEHCVALHKFYKTPRLNHYLFKKNRMEHTLSLLFLYCHVFG